MKKCKGIIFLFSILTISIFYSTIAYAAKAQSTDVLVKCDVNGVVTDHTPITGIQITPTYDTTNFYPKGTDIAIFKKDGTLVKQIGPYNANTIRVSFGSVTNYDIAQVYTVKYQVHYGVIGTGPDEILDGWKDTGVYFTAEIGIPPTPGAPSVTVVNMGFNEYSISWSAVAGATSYELFRDDVYLKDVVGTSTTDTSSLLGYNKQHSYALKAKNVSGKSALGPATARYTKANHAGIQDYSNILQAELTTNISLNANPTNTQFRFRIKDIDGMVIQGPTNWSVALTYTFTNLYPNNTYSVEVNVRNFDNIANDTWISLGNILTLNIEPDSIFSSLMHNQVLDVNGTKVEVKGPDTPVDGYNGSLAGYNTFRNHAVLTYRLRFTVPTENISKVQDVQVDFSFNDYNATGINLVINDMGLYKEGSGLIKPLAGSYTRLGRNRYLLNVGNDDNSIPMIIANGAGKYYIEYTAILLETNSTLKDVRNDCIVKVYTGEDYGELVEPEKSTHRTYVETRID